MTRSNILSSIQQSLKRPPLTLEKQAELAKRLTQHLRGVIPNQSQGTLDERITLFKQKVLASAASLEVITSLEQIPLALLRLCSEQKNYFSLRFSSDPLFKKIAFEKYPDLNITEQPLTPDEKFVSLTAACCGIAETGTLLLLSSASQPTALNFLAEIHVVVVNMNTIVGSYEDAFDLIRTHHPIPRSINFITGPSRTGDIEQKILLGMHGPKRLHIFLCERGLL